MKSERISPFWVNGYQPFSAWHFNLYFCGISIIKLSASKSGQVAAFQSLYPQILKLAYNVLMTFHSAMNIHMGVDGLHPSLRLSYYFIST